METCEPPETIEETKVNHLEGTYIHMEKIFHIVQKYHKAKMIEHNIISIDFRMFPKVNIRDGLENHRQQLSKEILSGILRL